MKKNYIILLTIIALASIIISVSILPYIQSDSFLLNHSKSNEEISTVLIFTDNSVGTAPLRVNFKSLVQNFDKDVQYHWDFGDGESSSLIEPVHIFEESGSFNCTLRVTDGSSASVDSVMITVQENNPPIIKIIVDKTSGNRPMLVNFDVDGFDTDGEIISYDWKITYPPIFSFQKITTHDQRNFSGRFLIPGFYEVKLTVIDDTGNVATDYIKIQVLGSKIELMIKTGLFYASMINGAIQVYNKINNLFFDNEPQTVVEKFISFFGGR